VPPDERALRHGQRPTPQPRARPRRRVRWVAGILALLVVAVGVGVYVGLIVEKRVYSGAWALPDGNDLSRVGRMITGSKPAPPRTIYLHRGPITLTPGADDAGADRSSVLASFSPQPASLRGYRGSDKKWNATVKCVAKLFAPFDVTVTDRRPTEESGRAADYMMVVVGGKPRDIHAKGNVSGLAPFSGDVIPGAVVFGFSDALANDVTKLCETIGMEVAHAYGLDHGYDCKDVMTYLGRCGARSFLDKDVPCGEKTKRPCAGGDPTQNSYRHLADVLGLITPPTSSPVAPR
jgi:hypothetical protein